MTAVDAGWGYTLAGCQIKDNTLASTAKSENELEWLVPPRGKLCPTLRGVDTLGNDEGGPRLEEMPFRNTSRERIFFLLFLPSISE